MTRKNPEETKIRTVVLGIGPTGTSIAQKLGVRHPDIHCFSVDYDTPAAAPSCKPQVIAFSKASTEYDATPLNAALAGADMVFIIVSPYEPDTHGLASLASRTAHAEGVTSVALIPMAVCGLIFQGKTIVRIMQEHTDTVIPVSPYCSPNFPAASGVLDPERDVRYAENAVYHTIDCLIRLILDNLPIICFDFADVRDLFQGEYPGLLGATGSGSATGHNRTVVAAKQAVHSALREIESAGAEGQKLLAVITGGPDLTLNQIVAASDAIHEEIHEDVSVVIGVLVDSCMTGHASVCIAMTEA